MIVGGWTATAVVFWFCRAWDARPPDRLWGAVLVVGTVVGAVIALVVIDVIRVRRDSVARPSEVHWSEFTPGFGAWFWGGLFVFALYHVLFRQPGINVVLGVVSAVSATPALAALFIVGRRSRVAAWLSPVVVAGLYLLAVRLWNLHFWFPVPS